MKGLQQRIDRRYLSLLITELAFSMVFYNTAEFQNGNKKSAQ